MSDFIDKFLTILLNTWQPGKGRRSVKTGQEEKNGPAEKSKMAAETMIPAQGEGQALPLPYRTEIG